MTKLFLGEQHQDLWRAVTETISCASTPKAISGWLLLLTLKKVSQLWPVFGPMRRHHGLGFQLVAYSMSAWGCEEEQRSE